VGLCSVQAAIDAEEVLQFDKHYYTGMLKRYELDRDHIQEVLSIKGKGERGFIETVQFCCAVNVLANDFWYMEYYKKYMYLLTKVEEDVNMTKEDISRNSEFLHDTLISTLAEQEASLLNDLECLCLNTKFGLINYDVVYNLIVQLFEFIIQKYYIELMESTLTQKEAGYEVFSNIIDVYNELMVIKTERLRNI